MHRALVFVAATLFSIAAGCGESSAPVASGVARPAALAGHWRFTDVLTSLRAFGANVPAMLVWGALIVVLIATGFALYFAGLVVAVPVIGHATWHAYRDLVDASPVSP